MKLTRLSKHDEENTIKDSPPTPSLGETCENETISTQPREIVIGEVVDTQENIKASLPMEDSFALFWQTYPKKTKNVVAEREWFRLNPTDEQLNQILTAIKNQSKSPQWREGGGRYIPDPANWLRNRQWEDEVDIGKQTTYGTATQALNAAIEALATEGVFDDDEGTDGTITCVNDKSLATVTAK